LFVLEVLETTLYHESLKKEENKKKRSLLNQKVVKCLCGLGEEIISNFSITHTKRTTLGSYRTQMFIYPTRVSLPQIGSKLLQIKEIINTLKMIKKEI